MITGHIFIAASLDGYIAREDGDIGWLLERDDPSDDHGYNDFIADIDVILMGRGTFDSVRCIRPWPYTRPVVVLSSTLADGGLPMDLSSQVRVMSAAPSVVMQNLASEGIKRVYVDGGRVIQSFLDAGLISDIVITWVPILLGGGRNLFGPRASDILLTHESTRSFASGLVQSRYRIAS